tara:strand:- start:1935 stop:2231 length:297 start_codon:yes stop_codon:yes gene_type:complete
MRTNDRLNAVEHIWHEQSDRWIYIERYASGYLGLNCMQGDDYEYFKKNWGEIDRGMSEFYSTMKSDLITIRAQMGELEFIDKVMWIYLESRMNFERYK